MKIIQRHYLKEFFNLFVIIALGLAVISSLIDLIDKLDDFIKYSPAPSLILLYAALDIPRYLVYLMPVRPFSAVCLSSGRQARGKKPLRLRLRAAV